MERVTGYGLHFLTELPIPGTIASGTHRDRDAVDVVITLSDQIGGPPMAGALDHPPPDPAQDTSQSPYRLFDGGLRFNCPDVAHYDITPDRIVVTPWGGGANPRVGTHVAAGEAMSAMLVATALPALLWLRGRYVLHAGAARLAGATDALVIAGASGSGKSSVIAQMVGRGAALLADDTTAFDLRIPNRDATGLPGGWYAPLTIGLDRAMTYVPAAQSLDQAPVAAILVLSGDDGIGLPIRLSAIDAVGQLLDHRHRPRVPALLGQMAQVLRDAATLAQTIPVYRWPRAGNSAPLSPAQWDAIQTIHTKG